MPDVGESYKRAQLPDQWDAIVIGSGLGGLTAANLLARQGKRVLVLERHYVIGGFTHTFKRKGYEWDVGVHYVGEVHRERSVLGQLFRHVTDDALAWADMGEVYDRLVFGETIYELRSGVQAFKDGLREHFPTPAHARSIDAYVDLVFAASKAARSYFAEKALSGVSAMVAAPFMRRGYLAYTRRSTWDTLRELTDDPRLIGVLTGQYGDYGLPPRQSSFAMHASVAKHYMFGGNYPVGGSVRFAETIAPAVGAAGGRLLTNAEVEEIIVQKGKAQGVRMADGRSFVAPLVISNAGVYNTYGRLLASELRDRFGLGAMLKQLEPSASHLCLYLGLDQPAEALAMPKANYWIFPDDYDHDATVARFLDDDRAPLPVVYASFPGAKDPDFGRRHPGKSTVELITLAPWARFEAWKDQPWRRRGDDYEALKEGYTERLLAELFRFEPQLREAIDHKELSTPLSTRHFTAYAQGEIYGLSHDPARFEPRFLRPQSPVKGLYLTGQDIVTCGIGAALFSGYLTVSAITGRNAVTDALDEIARRGAGDLATGH